MMEMSKEGEFYTVTAVCVSIWPVLFSNIMCWGFFTAELATEYIDFLHQPSQGVNNQISKYTSLSTAEPWAHVDLSCCKT